MPGDSANMDAADRQDRLRAVIERDYDRLSAGIAAMLCQAGERLEADELKQRVEETLGETVQRALSGASHFDPERSGSAWLLGIAAHVLKARRRGWVRTRRVLPQTDVGKDDWDVVLEQLSAASAEKTEADRIDLESALALLDADHREVIVLRFYQGLDGVELARYLNLPSAGAARVRLCRALQALRTCFTRMNRSKARVNRG